MNFIAVNLMSIFLSPFTFFAAGNVTAAICISIANGLMNFVAAMNFTDAIHSFIANGLMTFTAAWLPVQSQVSKCTSLLRFTGGG